MRTVEYAMLLAYVVAGATILGHSVGDFVAYAVAAVTGAF